MHECGFGRGEVANLPPAIGPTPATISPLSEIRDAVEKFSESAGGDDASPKEHDVFICHASEDKAEVAEPLAEALRARGLAVWYDAFSMKMGDSLRRSIDRGLIASRFGVVVLSTTFFGKGYANYELDGLVTREVAGSRQLTLPIWHKVTRADVMEYSPSLADKLARSTTDRTIDEVADEIAAVVSPRDEDSCVRKAVCTRAGTV